MQIQAAPQPPKALFEQGNSLTVTRTFDEPVLKSTRLGGIPMDTYSSSVIDVMGVLLSGKGPEYGPVDVWRDVPQYAADGKPQMQTVTRTLSESSYSQKWSTLAGAGGGLAAGVGGVGLLSALAPAYAFHPGVAAAAAGVGAAAGAAIGYIAARGDKVSEEQHTDPIEHPTLVGYTHMPVPDTHQVETGSYTDSKGNRQPIYTTVTRGYFHNYSPDINWRKVGDYTHPVLVHSNAVNSWGAAALGGATGLTLGAAVGWLAHLL